MLVVRQGVLTISRSRRPLLRGVAKRQDTGRARVQARWYCELNADNKSLVYIITMMTSLKAVMSQINMHVHATPHATDQ